MKYIKKGSVVADLGCGYKGNFLKAVSNKIKNGVGYDASVTKHGLPKNIALIKIDLNKKFNSRGGIFDAITVLAVLEHVENPENFLKQIKMLLKKGGNVIITTPHKRSKKLLEFLSFDLGLISKAEIKDHKNYFDEKSLKKLLAQTGFKISNIGSFQFGLNLFCLAKKIN